jgi:hypothetical protein
MPDIWRAANLLLKRYGHEAGLVAARRADETLADGDVEGCATWMRVLHAVGELTRATLTKGEQVN